MESGSWKRWTALLVLAGVLACGTDEGGSLFGAGTQGSGNPTTASPSTSGDSTGTGIPTTSISASGGDGDGGDSNSDPTLGGSSGGDTGSPTSGAASTSDATTSGTGESDSTSSSSTGAGEESSSSSSSTSGAGDDDGGMGGMQPADGMYSPCVIPDDCGFAPELCITISDMDGMLLDGFCSETTCNDPMADCDVAPGGTAMPACIDVSVDGMPDSACVLDCSGGASCPTGMTCYSLGGTSICG